MENISVVLFWIALVFYLLGAVGYFFYFAFRQNAVGTVGTIMAVIGVAAHLGSIATRWIAAGHSPIANMYEYTSLLAVLLMVSYLIVEFFTKSKVFGGLATGAAFLFMGLARLFYAEPTPLMPALKSYWLDIHVFTMVISSGILGVGFIFALLYVLKQRTEDRARPQVARSAKERPAIAGGATATYEGHSSGFLGRLPAADVLDHLSYRTTAFGFPLWTLGVIAGAIWAEQAWGRYWGWDPKETWSLITWLVYAGYLHARVTAGWRGRPAAWLSALGFAALLFTFYAVNLWISGLHSYA